MPLAAPTTGTTFKITQRFEWGAWGWTESYYCSKAGMTVEDARVQSGRIAAVRKKFLDLKATIQSVTISPTTTTLGAKTYNDILVGCGPGLYASSDVEVWQDVMYRQSDISGLYKKAGRFRGVSLSTVTWTPTGGTVNPGTVTSDAVVTLLRFLNNNVTTGFPKFCIRGRSHDATATNRTRILSAAAATNGCDTVFTLAVAGNWAEGQKVSVTKVRGCLAKGLNGDHVVTKVDGRNITVTGKQCCCGQVTVLPTGFLQLVIYDYYPIFNVDIQDIPPWTRVTKRNTGTAGGQTRGRRRKKCG